MKAVAGIIVGSIVSIAALASSGAAQARSFTTPSERQAEVRIPKGFMPPSGMCRIWLENVPPVQQPAPTDCATAIKRKPRNGRVIFGERNGKKEVNPRAPKDTTRARKPDHRR
jgi:hypothetical protein